MASIALTLLQLAVTLLLSVQNNPNASPQAIAQAIASASQAVQFAQEVLGSDAGANIAGISANSQAAVITASLAANGKTDLSILPGTNVVYVWGSTGGNRYSSSLSIYDATGATVAADPCGNKATAAWVIDDELGSLAGTTAECQVGYHYVITYQVTNTTGDLVTAEAHIAVTNTPTPVEAPAANISGIQGYDPATDAYVDGTATTNSWLILYGTFAASGDKVLIDGMSSVPDYQSVNQLNISLAGIQAGTHTISVVTPAGISAPASFVVADQAPQPIVDAKIGTYIWGKQYVSAGKGPVADPVAFAAAKGFKVVRLALSPRSSLDYGISTACDANLSLADLAATDQFEKAFSTTAISTFILTTYEHATYGDCATPRFLNPSFYTPANTALISKEYQDLVLSLYQKYQGTGKTFIISNWEGDNQLYCGDAYGYATNTSVRALCDASYAAKYNGNTSVADSITGMKDWLMARKAGIVAGKAAAAAKGLSGVSVYFAAEFNSVHALHDNNFRSVLFDILPEVKPDYVSYSSYESINGANPGTTLSNDLQTVKGVMPGSGIIIGEYGYNHDALGDAAAQADLLQVTNAIKSSGVAYGIVWQLFDQPAGEGSYGLFGATGSPKLMNAFLPKQSLPL